MDTRNKILTLERACALPAGDLVVVTGTFDILRAEHARDLAWVRDRTAPHPILVVVSPVSPEFLPAQARAELVAALRMVDYVVIAQDGDLDRLIGEVRPAEVVRLEAADRSRIEQLIAHVHRRQT